MSRQLSPFPLFAFNVLETHLRKHSVSGSLTAFKQRHTLDEFKEALGIPTTRKDEPSPLFITWNIKDPIHHSEKELRGCIGTFSPLEVERGISEYALIAALEDTRFTPITLEELPLLSVSVTLLQHFEKVENPFDWELGKHGIRISFVKNGKTYGATFLPEVATEQGWDKEETLQHLVAKAGYRHGKLDVREIKLTRYQGVKSEVTYKEYQEFLKTMES